MKKYNYDSRSYVSRSTTTSVTSYNNRNLPAHRYGNGSSDLSRAASHVLRSNNPRTQATGVAIGTFAAVTAVCGVAALALDIIGGRRR